MGIQVWPPLENGGTKYGRIASEGEVIFSADPTSISTAGITWDGDIFEFETVAGGVAFTDEYDSLHFVVPAKSLFTGDHITGQSFIDEGSGGSFDWAIDHLTDVPDNIRVKCMFFVHTTTPTALTDFTTMWGTGYDRAARTNVVSNGSGGGSTTGAAFTNPDSSRGGFPSLAETASGSLYLLNMESAMWDGGQLQVARSSAAAGVKMPNLTDELYIGVTFLRVGALTGGQTYRGRLTYKCSINPETKRGL